MKQTFDEEKMKPAIRISVAVLLHSLAAFLVLLAVGVVWAAVYVFGLGKWETIFGPWGTMQIYFLIAAAFAGIQAGVFLLCHSIWAVINRGFSWQAGIYSIALLALGNVGLPFLAPLGNIATLAPLVILPPVCSIAMITQKRKKQASNQSENHDVSPGADAG